MIPKPKEGEQLSDFIGRCMRSGNVKKAYPDRKKRVSTIKKTWHDKRNNEKMISMVNEYHIRMTELMRVQAKKVLEIEIESFPLSKLHPIKAKLFKLYYSTMRRCRLPIEDAYNLSIRKVNRLKMGMIA